MIEVSVPSMSTPSVVHVQVWALIAPGNTRDVRRTRMFKRRQGAHRRVHLTGISLPPRIAALGSSLHRSGHFIECRRRGHFLGALQLLSLKLLPEQHLQNYRESYHLIDDIEVHKPQECPAHHEAKHGNLDHVRVIDQVFRYREVPGGTANPPQGPETGADQHYEQTQADKTLVGQQLEIDAVRTAGEKTQRQGSRLIALENIHVRENVEGAPRNRIIVCEIPCCSPGN